MFNIASSQIMLLLLLIIACHMVITLGHRCQNIVKLCDFSIPNTHDVSNSTTGCCGEQNQPPRIDDVAWKRLSLAAKHVMRRQNTIDLLQCSGHPTPFTVVVYYDDTRWRVAKLLEEAILEVDRSITFVYFETSSVNLSHTFDEVNAFYSDVINVVFITDAIHVIAESMDYVMSNMRFHWTAMIHVTEWFIVSNRDLLQMLEAVNKYPDFVTMVFAPQPDLVSVAQKSRKHRLEKVIGLQEDTWSMFSGCLEGESHPDMTSHCQALDQEMETMTATGNLRLNGWLHVRTERSVMDGMHVTVPMFTTTMDFRPQDESGGTFSENLAAELLKVMADSLGFTYEKILVEDGGYYGAVRPTGMTGITGMLARREAALSIIPLSMIDNRQGYIDYVPYPTTLETNKLVYMLPSSGDNLDLTFVEIVSPDFVLFLLGPLFGIGIVGALVHLATRSCTSVGPLPFGWKDTRQLLSYPKHVFFYDADTKYASHSGRILRASWGLFWVVLGAAYSAYLTTTLAVRSKELTITSLKTMLETPGYTFGVNGRMSGLMTLLETSQNNDLLRDAWNRLVHYNKTDPLTFTDNVTYHMQKVFSGRYIFITPMPLSGVSMRYIKREKLEVRSYSLEDFPSLDSDYIGLPTNVFYRDELYNYVLKLEESSVRERLKDIYMQEADEEKDGHFNDQVPISLGKLLLLIYVIIGGVVVAGVLLVGEIAIKRIRRDQEKPLDIKIL